MTNHAPRDLTVLHNDILAAKGGRFGALRLTQEPSVPASRRVYRRLLGVPVLGGAARRAVVVARRARAKVDAQ